jgi:hypothetical protein
MLFLAACNSSSDELASPESAAISSRSQQARAFHGNLAGALNVNSAPTACTGLFPLAVVDYFMSGNATHLGNLNASSFLHHDDCNVDVTTFLLTSNVSGHLVGQTVIGLNTPGRTRSISSITQLIPDLMDLSMVHGRLQEVPENLQGLRVLSGLTGLLISQRLASVWWPMVPSSINR